MSDNASPASDPRAHLALTDAVSGEADPMSVAMRSLHAMVAGDRADFELLIHADAVDHENDAQPPSSRVPGPAGFHSTALWLRAAFADLHYDIHHAVADGTLVAVRSTMNGRHVARAVYTPDGAVDTVFPQRTRRSRRPSPLWCRIEDAGIIESARLSLS